MPQLHTAGRATLKVSLNSLGRRSLIGLLCVFPLFSITGCGADLSGVLSTVLGALTNATDATLNDLVGTWTGTLTENSTSSTYQFTIDPAGNFVAADGTTGTVTVSSDGAVVFTYTANGYTITLQGTLNSAKTTITMATSSWTGTATGSAAFTGTLTKSTTSGSFTAADLVGTWAGSMTENGQTQSYQFIVDSSGNFTTTGGLSGTATISSSGTVVFSYSSSSSSGTFQGLMDSSLTQIVMSTHTWAGTTSGTAAFTGTLTKSTSTTTFASSDLVGTWAGSVTENGQAQNYQFIVDASGNFVAGDSTTGTVTISSTGTVTFAYTSGGYTINLQGAMSSDKKTISMTTSSWTGTATGSAAFTGTLTKS